MTIRVPEPGIIKIRAIDFDQQCYEGKFMVYQPFVFKENTQFVNLVREKLGQRSIEQYRNEERALLAKRIITSKKRLYRLLKVMAHDNISNLHNIKLLRNEIYKYTSDVKFKRSTSMGEIVRAALDFVKRNYEDINFKNISKDIL